MSKASASNKTPTRRFVTCSEVAEAYDKFGSDMVEVQWKNARSINNGKYNYIDVLINLVDGRKVKPFIKFYNETTGGVKSVDKRPTGYSPSWNYKINHSEIARIVELLYKTAVEKIKEAEGVQWIKQENEAEADELPDIISPSGSILPVPIYKVKVKNQQGKLEIIHVDEPFIRVEPKGRRGDENKGENKNETIYDKITIRDTTKPRSVNNDPQKRRSEFPLMKVEEQVPNPENPNQSKVITHTSPTEENFHMFITPGSVTSGTVAMTEIKMSDKGISFKPYIVNTIYCARGTPNSGADMDEDELDMIDSSAPAEKSEVSEATIQEGLDEELESVEDEDVEIEESTL